MNPIVENIVGNGVICAFVSSIFSFAHNFFKTVFLRFVQTRDCLVKVWITCILCLTGVDTDELDNLSADDYEEEVVEFLLKVEEIILDEE